jgi:hypothetical protein
VDTLAHSGRALTHHSAEHSSEQADQLLSCLCL